MLCRLCISRLLPRDTSSELPMAGQDQEKHWHCKTIKFETKRCQMQRWVAFHYQDTRTCYSSSLKNLPSPTHLPRSPDIVYNGVRRKFSWGGFTQWHVMVICIWCAPFLTSQFDVIFMFPNQHFGEVCWHNIHILLHALALFYVSLHWIQTISAPS